MKRYRVVFSNGFWKTFDSLRFEDAQLHSTYAEAVRHVDIKNG